jgi:Na+/proline symporter
LSFFLSFLNYLHLRSAWLTDFPLQILVTWILKRYNHELQTSEMFSTAGRTVKSGLVASAVVSSWTWAATLLQSSGVAYKYGVSGPFWYASGATVQILLFATIAIELKRRAPNAHVSFLSFRASGFQELEFNGGREWSSMKRIGWSRRL